MIRIDMSANAVKYVDATECRSHDSPFPLLDSQVSSWRDKGHFKCCSFVHIDYYHAHIVNLYTCI